MAQSEQDQGTPFRFKSVELTEIERLASVGILAKELARVSAKEVRPFGADEMVEKGIDYLARPDLRDSSEE